MFCKIIGHVLLNLMSIFIKLKKMCSLYKDKELKADTYLFKPFKYTRIQPSHDKKLPLPRSGHRIGADSANFYSFGGYNPLERDHMQLSEEESEFQSQIVTSMFQELWRFNFATKKWYRFPNSEEMPTELASNALILHRNLLMIYGGTGYPFGYRCSNKLYICRVNEEGGKMAYISATGDMPLPLYGQAVMCHENYLYTIGGTSGLSYNIDIYRLNLKTFVWEIVYLCNGKSQHEPEGRYRHEIAFDGVHIYILGGGTSEQAYGFSSIPAFNLKTLEWKKREAIEDSTWGFPLARRCHGAVQINTETGIHVYIMGGNDGDYTFRDLWKLDLGNFRWTNFVVCQMPRPLYFHAVSATPDGKLYVFGGINQVDLHNKRTNSIYTTWLSIPKLSEICWEAVLEYYPHLTNCNPSDLVSLGIPAHFVSRISNK